MKKYLLLLSFLFVKFCYAQSNDYLHCGADEMAIHLLQENAGLLNNWIRNYYQSEDFISTFDNSRTTDTIFKVPVVVHVIHFDGAENITDDQIKNGIDILTRNYRKQNPDTIDIVPFFQPIAADMAIEFELARLDPDGECTSGINRIRSTFTNTGGHEVKSLIHWPRDKYLNIYVVKNAAGLAGHALMPFQADSIPELDGIVIAGNYFGNIGTSNDVRSVVLSHETGHFLNLYHVWGGNNVPGFYYLPCADTGNCAYDDGVVDTPNTIGWPSCNLAGNTCDSVLDNVQNFMDYAYCARMFTEGQKVRARASLHSPLSQRDQLWTTGNLTSTGLTGPLTLCKSDFTTPRQTYCSGDSIQFSDGSLHGATGWTWDFGDGNFSTLQNPKHVYTNGGIYDVSLTVTNGTSTITASKSEYMYIINGNGLVLPYTEWFEWIDSLDQSGMTGFVENDHTWEIVQGSGATGNQCTRVQSELDTSRFKYTLISPELNLTGYSDPEISFYYAFAQKDSTNNDIMYFRMSTNCGKTWGTLNTQTNTLPTHTGYVAGNYVPDQADWRNIVISNIPVAFQTNGVIFKIEFISGGGNDLYVDDINVYDLATIGMDHIDTQPNIQVYPNPASEYIIINTDAESISVELFDIHGKKIKTKNIQGNTPLPVNELANGIYLLKICIDGSYWYKKIVIRR